jgi:hypothetical protein
MHDNRERAPRLAFARATTIHDWNPRKQAALSFFFFAEAISCFGFVLQRCDDISQPTIFDNHCNTKSSSSPPTTPKYNRENIQSS